MSVHCHFGKEEKKFVHVYTLPFLVMYSDIGIIGKHLFPPHRQTHCHFRKEGKVFVHVCALPFLVVYDIGIIGEHIFPTAVWKEGKPEVFIYVCTFACCIMPLQEGGEGVCMAFLVIYDMDIVRKLD